MEIVCFHCEEVLTTETKISRTDTQALVFAKIIWSLQATDV